MRPKETRMRPKRDRWDQKETKRRLIRDQKETYLRLVLVSQCHAPKQATSDSILSVKLFCTLYVRPAPSTTMHVCSRWLLWRRSLAALWMKQCLLKSSAKRLRRRCSLLTSSADWSAVRAILCINDEIQSRGSQRFMFIINAAIYIIMLYQLLYYKINSLLLNHDV
jgi:hypothetical protein